MPELPRNGSPAVEASGLGKQYKSVAGAFWVFRGLDLVIQRGEMVCISGPSGCGKTTLLALLAGLERPTEGQVKLMGNRIDNLKESAAAAVRRQTIGFVFQFFYLLPNLTVHENIALPMMAAKARHRDTNRATELADRLGLGARLRHYPRQLSGGEQQRVALARAVVGDPSIILADEPTGNLDAESAREVLALLRAQAQAGRTVLVVSHNRMVADLSDREIDLAQLGSVEVSR